MNPINIVNKTYPVYFSKVAYNDIENKLTSNFCDMTMPSKKWYMNFQLTVEWIRAFYYCINELPNSLNELEYNGKYWIYKMRDIGMVYLTSFMDKNMNIGLRVDSFSFNNVGIFTSLFCSKETTSNILSESNIHKILILTINQMLRKN